MGDLVKEGSLFSAVNTIGGAVTAAIGAMVILAFLLVVHITKLNLFEILRSIISILFKGFGAVVNKSETNYHRDLEIGKIDAKRSRVKIYRFLNDLTIDLGIKQKGATPYEFLFIVIVCNLFCTVALCKILFGNLYMSFVMYPILFAAVMCILYTKANVSHDQRIEAVIEAENVICNNISAGIEVAIRNSIDVIPTQVRDSFRDFIDNIEHKNYHIRTALMELNSNLGSVADDFIKKCIVYATEDQHGISGMFQDVVEVNNIKMEMRTEMKRRFEEVKNEFIIGGTMIFVFLGGVIAVYKDVAAFYLRTPLGQIIIAIDFLIVIAEFVYITYLRAKEL